MMSVSFLQVLAYMGVVGSVLTLCLQYKHLLGMLLSLEAMMLSVFVLLYSLCGGVGALSGHWCLLVLGVSACEASLGLAILVSLIRTHGSDYVRGFSGHKC